jgi:hypothetical protein
MDRETLKTSFEAVRESASMTNNLINKIGKVGSCFEGMLREIGGQAEGNAKFRRWENQQKLIDKAQHILAARGIEAPTRDVPLNMALPLLGYASLEENDELQDLWARLLANAADASSGVEPRTTYVEMLKGLSTFDVRIFEMLARLSHSDFPQAIPLGIETAELPLNARVRTTESVEFNQPTEHVKLSLSNLEHLGCIAVTVGFGGMSNFALVYVTPLGMGLYRACVR